MDKGSVFEKDGKHYQIRQEGTKYLPDNQQRCIRPPGKPKCISIQTALKQRLICEEKEGDLLLDDKPPSQEKIEEKSDIIEPYPPQCIDLPKKHLDNDNIYYMLVDQLRAQVFLAHGLIYPAIYDKPSLSVDFHDSQRQTPDRLTLYETPQLLHHNQLLLRILLNQNEIANVERNGEMLHLGTPLPISRLVGIKVSPVAGGLDRYIDGWVKPDVPVPRHLFVNATVPLSPDQENPHRDSPPRDAQPRSDIAESIARFDRYLGIMAFLRNVARYFSEKTGHYADYPDIFFPICEHIMGKAGLAPAGCPAPDPLIMALLGFDIPKMSDTAKSLLDLVNSQEPYISKNKGDKASNLAGQICKANSDKEILKEALVKLFSGDYRSAISKLQAPDMPIEAAILAGLLQFSVRLSHGYRSVKQRLHEDWSNQNQARLLLAALGAYYGYTALDAQETTLYSVHPLILPVIEEHPEIKFHLRTRFERELIEALYRRAFFTNEPIQDSSPLFSTVITPQPLPDPKLSGLPIDETTYTVQDLVVRQYKVTSSEDSAHAPVQEPVVPKHETTPVERLIQQLKTWKRDTINDQSNVGTWLMGSIHRYAEKLQINFEKEKPNPVIGYSITKDEFIELIRCGTITFEPEGLKFLEVLIKKDNDQ